MEELADTYRPVLLDRLRNCNPETQEFLMPAVEKALDGIEWMCPVAMAATIGGVKTAYGPTGELATIKFLIMATNREKYFVFGRDSLTWPKAPDYVKSKNPTVMWAAISKGVDLARASLIFDSFNARCMEPDKKVVVSEFRKIRKHGYVPVLTLISALEEYADGRLTAAGISVVLPLPPSIEKQLGDID